LITQGGCGQRKEEERCGAGANIVSGIMGFVCSFEPMIACYSMG